MPKLAGNDWIAPVQRLLPDRRFCDVSSGPTASQQLVGRASFLDVETVWNELTSVIPRIEMIARFTSRRTIESCTVLHPCNAIRRKISAAPFRRNQFDCQQLVGHALKITFERIWLPYKEHTRERHCPNSSIQIIILHRYHYHHSGSISLDCGCGQQLCTENATSEK